MRLSLAGKRVVITGASSGLGEHFARVMSGAGASLSLIHPGTSQTVVWKAPLSDDMQSLISALRVDTVDR